jgi:hypothetical protein
VRVRTVVVVTFVMLDVVGVVDVEEEIGMDKLATRGAEEPEQG